MTKSMNKDTLLDVLTRYSHPFQVESASHYMLVPEFFFDIVISTLKEDLEGVKIKLEPTGIRCGNCGRTIDRGYKFCHECGKPIKWPD